MTRCADNIRVFNIPYQAFILWVATALIIGSMIWIEVINRPILLALEARGIDAKAEVTRFGPIIFDPRPTPGGANRDVFYSYRTFDGTTVDDKRRVGRHVWDRLTIGGTIDVRYLPDRPEIHTASILSGYAGRGMLVPLALMGVATVVLGTFLFFRAGPAQRPRLYPVISFR
ncbi:MAG: DUF3592 domain-containing protein [Pseudomonadota bacterium]